MKKAKLRRRQAVKLKELEARFTDAGIMVSKMEIRGKLKRLLKGALPKAEMKEFMPLWRGLHRDYLRFGDRSRA